MTTETHAFKAEVTALLRLVTNSLYTNREIFIRELISNASDALDKARFESLTRPELRGSAGTPTILITLDKTHNLLIIEDDGVGMTREELSENLGTIAHSGTRKFLDALNQQQNQQADKKPDLSLIGNFGVGFYSAFMVADSIEVESLSAYPGNEAARWVSCGDGTFTLDSSSKKTRGTRIALHLKEDAREFLERYRIEALVQRYSNYVMHPITLQVVGDSADKPEDEEDGSEPRQINKASAIWARPAKDLSDDDYEAFYKHVMGGFVLPGDKPLARLHVSMDAPIQFHALLYVPGRAPADLFMEDRKALQLFARRVLIMDSCDKLLPTYLRFFRGAVDSEDLPLNVSREMLQEHKSLSAIRKQLTRKSLKLLTDMAGEQPEQYEKFWREFGSVVKEGIHTDNGHREELTQLLRYPTTTSGGALVSLSDYVAAMPSDQPAIYYITGESAEALVHSPHLEACRAKGYAVLLMADPVDEWVVQDLREVSGKPLRSVTQGNLDPAISAAESEVPAEFAGLVERAKRVLGGRVSDVRMSGRLTESAACLVDQEGGLGRNMERLLKMSGRGIPSVPKVLELNPSHAFVKAVGRRAAERSEDPQVDQWLELLLDQANLAEGHVPDPAATVKRIQSMLNELAEAQK